MTRPLTAPLLALAQLHEEYATNAALSEKNGDHGIALRFRYMAAGINAALQLMETFDGVTL